VRDDLGAPTLFTEEALEQICRPDCASVRDRQSQLRDAGRKVIEEAGGGRPSRLRFTATLRLHQKLAQNLLIAVEFGPPRSTTGRRRRMNTGRRDR
jgi:hypothetical protein